MADKSNVHILKSIMKHPKLSKVVGDAFNAPMGSTKRTQALAMLNSIYKVSGKRFQNNDGQGGEGGGTKNNLDKYLPYLQREPEVYDRLMIFNAAPKMRQDGQGGKGDLSLASEAPSTLPSKWNINLKINPETGAVYDAADLLKGYNVQQEDVKNRPTLIEQYEGLQIGKPSIGERITPKTVFPGISKQLPRWGGIQGAGQPFQIELPKQMKKVKTGIVINGEEQYADVPVEEEKPKEKPAAKKPKWGPQLEGYKIVGEKPVKKPLVGPVAEKPSEIETTTVAQEESNRMYQFYINAGISEEEAATLAKGHTGIAPIGPSVEKEEAPTGPSQYKGLEKLAFESAGPETFYSDVSLLPLAERRKLFPGVPDELLPATTAELRTTLEKETKLKEWEEKQRQLAMQGNYLVPDMKEYIRNRDEYITDIDKNISNTMWKLSHLRTGDPKEEQDLKNNLTYLEVLKGRQTKRYTDFLTDSVAAFDKEAHRVETAYKQAKLDYQNRFNQSFEWQQSLKKSLTETWDSIKKVNDPMTLLEQEAKQLDNLKKQVDIFESVKKLGTNPALDPDVLKQMSENNKHFTDTKTGALLPYTILDIPEKVSFLIQRGQDPNGIIQSLSDAIDRKVDLSFSDFPSLYKEIKGLTGQIYNLGKNQTLNESLDAGGGKINGNMIASNLTKRLLEKSKHSFSNYLQDKRGTIIEAIKSLTPGDWFYGLPTKDSWVKTYSDKGLDKNFLEDLYDYYIFEKNNRYSDKPENSRAMFTGYDSTSRPIKKIDESNIEKVINRIYGGVSNSYLRNYGAETPIE